MADHFESAKRTVRRAKHHIDDLEQQIIAFTDNNTWTYVVDLDVDGFHQLHKIRFSQSLPADLPSILFDAVNNLRSSLDQCGYACAVAAKSKSTKHIKFPVAKNEAHFLKTVPGCCKDLPPEIITLFRNCKAYEGGNEILWTLNELCNTKKHFSLVPMTAGRAILKITPTAEHEFASNFATPEQIAKGASPAGFYGVVGGSVTQKNTKWDPSKNELLLLRTDPKKNVNYDANVSLTVSIEGIDILRRKPAVSVLKQMLVAVATVGDATEHECRRLGLI